MSHEHDTPQHTEPETNDVPLRGLARFFEICERNADKLFWGLCVICVVLFLADFFYHKHSYFSFENIPGFYGLYGLLAYCAIVLIAKVLRRPLRRDEDYYDA